MLSSFRCFGGSRVKDRLGDVEGTEGLEDELAKRANYTGIGENQEEVVISAKDEDAALHLLLLRDFVEDLEEEWPEVDDGWLDRVVVGRLEREVKETKMFDLKKFDVTKMGLGAKTRKPPCKSYLGFILLSTEAPFAFVNGGHVRQTSWEGEFLWPKWNQEHAGLPYDKLHFLPELSFDCDMPIDSLDLGRLTAVPTVEVLDRQTEQCVISLTFGAKLERILVSGELQALRWHAALKAAMTASMVWDTSNVVTVQVYEALKRFDKETIDVFEDEANVALHEALTNFLQDKAQDCNDNLDLFVDPEKLAPSVPFDQKMESLMALSENMLQTKLVMTLLKDVMTLPKTFVVAATRTHTLRMDILDFWKTSYHEPICNALAAVWNTRSKRLSVADIAEYAYGLDEYRRFLQDNLIMDTSLSDALEVVSACYTVESKCVFTEMMSAVAKKSTVLEREDGGLMTTAPVDVFVILGQALNMAATGPEELRYGAACVATDALNKYDRERRRVYKDVQSQMRPSALFAYTCAFVADRHSIGESLEQLAVMESTAHGNILDEGASGLLVSLGRTFSESYLSYAEKLSFMAMMTSGVGKAFGDPMPTQKAALTCNIDAYLEKVLNPMMATFQGHLATPCRGKFASLFVKRLVAFELFALLFSDDAGPLADTSHAAATLRKHKESIDKYLPTWAYDGLDGDASSCTGALEDMSKLLLVQVERVPVAMAALAEQYPDMSRDFALRLLSARGLESKDADKLLNAVTFMAEKEAQKTVFAYFHNTSEFADMISNSVVRTSWSDEWIGAWREDVRAVINDLYGPKDNPAANPQLRPSDDLEQFLNDVESDDYDLVSDFSELEAPPDVVSHDEELAPGSPHEDVKTVAEADAMTSKGTYVKPTFSGAMGKAANSDDEMSLTSSEEDDEYIVGYLMTAIDEVGKGQKKNVAAGLSNLKNMISSQKLRYFTVQRDIKGERNLCWYKDQSDMVATGMISLSEIIGIQRSVSTDCAQTPYLLELEVPKDLVPSGKIKLRSAYESECDLWYDRLTILRERQLAEEKGLVDRTEIVYTLRRTFRLVNPKGVGAGKTVREGLTDQKRKSLQRMSLTAGGLSSGARKSLSQCAQLA